MSDRGWKQRVPLSGAVLWAAVMLPAAAQAEGVSIVELQEQLQAQQLSSRQLVSRHLEAARRVRHLNAYVTLNEEQALAEADRLDALRREQKILGPLHGIPLVVKDNIHVAGIPSTAGTSALRDFSPPQDAPIIKRLKAAGAIILGKANMHELGFGITSNNYAFGAVGNAYDARYIAGGSSGGTAAAIGAGTVSAGLGTDTGGSVRIPAALNGLVGLRPTMGRYPAGGFSLSSTRGTAGPMAWTVADVALLDAVLSGEENIPEKVDLQTVRLGVPRQYFYEDLDAEVSMAMERVLSVLRQAGVELVEAELEGIGALNGKIGFPIVLYETRKQLPRYLEQHQIPLSVHDLINQIASPDVKQIMQDIFQNQVSEEAYREAREVQRPRLQQLYRDYFAAHRLDAMIFPVTPLPACLIEGSDETVMHNGREVSTFLTYIRNTDPSSNAGIPGLVLPAGCSRMGLPIGLELDGPAGSDRKLLALGDALSALLASSIPGCQPRDAVAQASRSRPSSTSF